MLARTTSVLAAYAVAFVLAGCDDPPSGPGSSAPPAGSVAPAAPTAPAPEPEPRAPDIIVERSTVSVGGDHVPTGETALADKIAVFLKGRPMIEAHAVDVVAMRDAKPSQVAAVLAALRSANATGVRMKTEARDSTTQTLPLSFATSVPDCTVVAWIAKDAAIDVWPAGGGRAKRIVRGLAGPDVTLGTEAIRTQWAGCGAPSIAVGAEDTMTWGLVFDLATNALQAPGSRANSAVLLPTAVPGRKLALE
jgi:hypothetical protein